MSFSETHKIWRQGSSYGALLSYIGPIIMIMIMDVTVGVFPAVSSPYFFLWRMQLQICNLSHRIFSTTPISTISGMRSYVARTEWRDFFKWHACLQVTWISSQIPRKNGRWSMHAQLVRVHKATGIRKLSSGELPKQYWRERQLSYGNFSEKSLLFSSLERDDE